jgi:hypothetical protein
MNQTGSVENNVKMLLRKSLLREPIELMTEVIVLCNSLQQKFPNEPETMAVVEQLLPIREAAQALDVYRTMALTENWIAGKAGQVAGEDLIVTKQPAI